MLYEGACLFITVWLVKVWFELLIVDEIYGSEADFYVYFLPYVLNFMVWHFWVKTTKCSRYSVSVNFIEHNHTELKS